MDGISDHDIAVARGSARSLTAAGRCRRARCFR